MPNDPINLPPDCAPWERQPGESARNFALFGRYRDLGPRRSLDAVARLAKPQTGGKPVRAPGHIQDLSRRWSWVERARASDDERDRQAREVQVEAIVEANRRHQLQIRAALNVAIRRVATIDPSQLTPSEAWRWTREGIAMERLILGEPIAVPDERPQNMEPSRGNADQPARVKAAPFVPSPEYLASVMKILEAQGALDDEPDAEQPEGDSDARE